MIVKVKTELSFRVDTVPVPQPRQRTRTFKTADGRPASQNYTPTTHPVNTFKAAVAETATLMCDGEPQLSGHLHLGVTIVVPRTKTLTKEAGTSGRVPLSKMNKGDWDNFGKAVSDAMEGIVYDNDCRIYSTFIQKFYAAEDESPHTLILVQEHQVDDGPEAPIEDGKGDRTTDSETLL